jgi:rhomboid protease GluP
MKTKYWILYVIIGLNILVWLLVNLLPNKLELLLALRKDNTAIANGEWYRLITAAFTHYDFFHIFTNMYGLYIMGELCIDVYKKWGTLVVYFVSAIGGSLASFYFSKSASIWASGAVFGLMGALIYYALYTKNQRFFQEFIQVLIVNLVIGLAAYTYIDNFAHVGGLVCGFLISILLPKKEKFTTIDMYDHT